MYVSFEPCKLEFLPDGRGWPGWGWTRRHWRTCCSPLPGSCNCGIFTQPGGKLGSINEVSSLEIFCTKQKYQTGLAGIWSSLLCWRALCKGLASRILSHLMRWSSSSSSTLWSSWWGRLHHHYHLRHHDQPHAVFITLAITTIIHHIYMHVIMNILICTYMYLTSDQVAEEMASLVAAHRFWAF